jgi:hypothetical protein
MPPRAAPQKGHMKKYKYNNKIVSKKFWLKTLKQYPGFKRKLQKIKEAGKYRVWQVC